MARWEIIHAFKCSKNTSVEFDVYDNQGLISFESMRHDEVTEVYLSPKDESILRDLLNKRHKDSNK